MRKLGKLIKEISASGVKAKLEKSSAVFVVRYSGLSSPDLSNLRISLKKANADLFVIRNKITKRTLKGLGCEDLGKFIEGPCGFIFVNEEPVSASKALCDFSKDHENLKLEAVFLKDKIIDRKGIEAMARLPSKDVLRAQVVRTLNAPIVKLVMVLNGNLKNLVSCLEQIKQKKAN